MKYVPHNLHETFYTITITNYQYHNLLWSIRHWHRFESTLVIRTKMNIVLIVHQNRKSSRNESNI